MRAPANSVGDLALAPHLRGRRSPATTTGAGVAASVPAGCRSAFAAADLGIHRVVVWALDDAVEELSSLEYDELARVAGLSLSSALAGSQVVILERGTLRDSSFSFTPGAPLYPSATGTLTQSPPSASALIVGWAISADTITIDPHDPVEVIE